MQARTPQAGHDLKMAKKSKQTQAEQSKRFIEKAREMGADETEAGQEKAFGKVGLGKSVKPKTRKAPATKP
jgi:hypothetical protein